MRYLVFRVPFRLRRGLRSVLLALLIVSPARAVAVAQSVDDSEEELEALGVVSETAWESPQYGFRIEWTDDWTVATDGRTVSDTDGGVDTLTINREDVTLAVTYIRSLDETPEDYMQRSLDLWEVSGNTEAFDLIEQGVANEIAYMMYTGGVDDETFAVLGEVRVADAEDSVLVLVVLTTEEGEEEVASGLEWVLDDIEVDREPAFQLYELESDESS